MSLKDGLQFEETRWQVQSPDFDDFEWQERGHGFSVGIGLDQHGPYALLGAQVPYRSREVSELRAVVANLREMADEILMVIDEIDARNAIVDRT